MRDGPKQRCGDGLRLMDRYSTVSSRPEGQRASNWFSPAGLLNHRDEMKPSLEDSRQVGLPLSPFGYRNGGPARSGMALRGT